ncbi:hypothetical protein SteCoe_17478 [Stentor coeruleus]|uniref:Uncharacterized protein n=1 Tax=Stentor coeruleus TaxID=5963 RepID=A0A1R2BYS7_9CILI|nr:hypothetical protein SteCoe_17478 [Stentor coeruleus]
MANAKQNDSASPKSTIIPYTSISAESNMIYQYLMNELENSLIKSPKLSPLMQNLQKLLNEVNFTQNKDLQEELLKKIKRWYETKTFTKTPKTQSSTPKPEKNHIIFKTDRPNIKNWFMPYVPKKFKSRDLPKKEAISNNYSISSFDVPNTRASSSEPGKHDIRRRMSQSPGIIMSIVNNFVKNKRVKTYNFTLESFLNDSTHKKVIAIDEKINRASDRPMSSSMRRQIQEVQDVKHKLTKRNISCGVTNIFHGLVVDDSIPEIICSLPKGGEYLIKKRK